MDAINRTFLGVRVPPELLPAIDSSLLLLKRKPGILDVRWNQPSEYLINLVTLGELSVGTIARIKDTIGPIIAQYPQFSLTMEKFAGLPNMIQPRFAVLQFAGEGTSIAMQLAAALDAATKPMVPPRDAKPFQPNMVLGRLKTESEQLRVALGRALRIPEHPPFGEWPVTEIELLISTSSTSGVGYKAIETFPLRG